MDRETITDIFPEVHRIDDDTLRKQVIDIWIDVLEDTGTDDPDTVQWLPPEQERLGLGDVSQVDHIRDVTRGAIALAEVALDRGVEVSMDTVVAGALLHDISKPYEFDADAPSGVTRLGDLVGHPYYGLHLVAAAGLSVEIMHIVVAHSPRTAVEPATIEAAIVTAADEAAADTIRWTGVDDLRNA